MAISRIVKSVSIDIRAWHVFSLKWNCIANKNNLYSKKLRAYGSTVIKNTKRWYLCNKIETMSKVLNLESLANNQKS